jgi:hypothetical protein
LASRLACVSLPDAGKFRLIRSGSVDAPAVAVGMTSGEATLAKWVTGVRVQGIAPFPPDKLTV